MTGLEIWLLAIGLAMDCFAVSIASGIILKRTRWKPMLVMAFAFGFFQAIMPFIGWMCAKTFSHLIESVDHWIAFAILAFLGGRMILESFKEEECCKLFNPANPKVVLTMAIATSIDALAIGISFAFLGVQDYTEILPPISIIGFVSFVMSLIGLIFGIQCGCGIARKLKAELWGGIILVIIGWMCAKTFSHLIESVDHWIAFAILAFLGGRMILESFKEEECCKLFNPANPKVVLTMAIATSIDALAIGISFAFLGVQDYTEILPPISIIGFVSFVMSLIGLIFGIQCGCGIARKLKAELWGGIILVIIGLKILIEHLFLQ